MYCNYIVIAIIVIILSVQLKDSKHGLQMSFFWMWRRLVNQHSLVILALSLTKESFPVGGEDLLAFRWGKTDDRMGEIQGNIHTVPVVEPQFQMLTSLWKIVVLVYCWRTLNFWFVSIENDLLVNIMKECID